MHPHIHTLSLSLILILLLSYSLYHLRCVFYYMNDPSCPTHTEQSMKPTRVYLYTLLLVTDLCITVISGDRCTVFSPGVFAPCVCHPLQILEGRESMWQVSTSLERITGVKFKLFWIQTACCVFILKMDCYRCIGKASYLPKTIKQQ